MGEYDRKRFRQVMIDSELYDRLSAMKKPGDTFADVIRRLLPPKGWPATKRGRPMAELVAIARVARRAWQRDLASGRVKLLDRAP
jgi:hypothetical protein